jgi:hypothetical protein
MSAMTCRMLREAGLSGSFQALSWRRADYGWPGRGRVLIRSISCCALAISAFLRIEPSGKRRRIQMRLPCPQGSKLIDHLDQAGLAKAFRGETRAAGPEGRTRQRTRIGISTSRLLDRRA